ncbi:MAG: hypothetical protein IJT44_10830 [Clostridia bacterium]|nr:hypothetical protein [Clostridia bacterium]
MDLELNEGYQNLVYAIVRQAVDDYRFCKRYLRKHHKTEGLVALVAEQVARREKREEKRKQANLPPIEEPRSQEEILLRRIERAEFLLADAIEFFHSDWFYMLTDVDGSVILDRLEAEIL